ncbi:hypothetical protein GMDG_03773 [Pseudogymnoascus destructans 20631-21]|uniref:Uncharacterized protein n=2 Tax=Pseudogymnoascus destructans TaxID=655981 RepID=L8GB03_PSED2|nr:hypothetical protein GMDG_03773 [Pseudogymnoascus destructans 20631-21]
MTSIFAERAYLLSSLQREDVRATALLTVIADINARMASSGAPVRAKEAKWLRRDLAAKRHAADMSGRQEKLILQRLGEVTLVIQQRERWWRVERERGMGAGTRVEVGMGGNAWGGWNGGDVVSWNGQQVQYDGQPQGYYGGQGWVQQVAAPGYVMATPPASTEGGGVIGCNDWQVQVPGCNDWQVQVPGSSDWQLPVPVDSSSDWNMSRISGADAMEQKPVRVARSDSMVEVAAGRRRAQSRMSMPDLSSRQWGGDCPQYLGYYSPGCSPEMTGGSVN